jgi:sporadic carbohydrate cluster 2OG-Fe(II) oxygenase
MTHNDTDFERADERDLAQAFLNGGHVILPAEDRAAIERMQRFVADKAAAVLSQPAPDDPQAFLDGIAELVDPAGLNDFRLGMIDAINHEPWFRPTYLALARNAIENIVGNELVMQRRINLSIQLPNDDSSLLPVHADVWSGDSPFEVVLWVPLVDCAASKSMYLMPPLEDRDVQAGLAGMKGQSSEDLFAAIEPHVRFLDVPFGSVLLFSQTLMHGNRINREADTRWSMNCRFKSVFSPYADKKLGEFFEPVTLRPNSRFAMAYQLPGGFDE